MADVFEIGELFVYVNGDRWELGTVKRPNNTGDGYFCWYSRGDTAANTPVRCMRKLANAGWTHVEQACDDRESLLRDLVQLVAVPAFDCYGCKYEEHKDCKDGCVLISRAKELGIEVENTWDS